MKMTILPHEYPYDQANLDFGHECVVRQRVRQKAINEGDDPEYALHQREYWLSKVQVIQKALDAQ